MWRGDEGWGLRSRYLRDESEANFAARVRGSGRVRGSSFTYGGQVVEAW